MSACFEVKSGLLGIFFSDLKDISEDVWREWEKGYKKQGVTANQNESRQTCFYFPWNRFGFFEGSPAGSQALKGMIQGSSPLRRRVKCLLTSIFYFIPLRFLLPRVILSGAGNSKHWDVMILSRSWKQLILMNIESEVLHLAGDTRTQLSFAREVDVRSKYTDNQYIPELKRFDEEGLFFVEQYVSGKPLYQLEDQEMERSTIETVEFMSRFYEKAGMKEVTQLDYVPLLTQQLEDAYKKLSLSEDELPFQKEQSYLEKTGTDTGTVFLGVSHGDLHLGNIVRFNERSMILDWQATAERSLYYDWFNLIKTARCHFHQSLFTRDYLQSLLQQGNQKNPGFYQHLIKNFLWYERLYFAERLLFYLEIPGIHLAWLKT